METMFDLVKRLYDDLMDAKIEDYKDEKWIKDKEIHEIRKCIAYLKKSGYKLQRFGFIDRFFGFSGIYTYFFLSEMSNYQNYDPYVEITAIFDPLLILLMEENYEVTIRKITPSETIGEIYPNNIINLLKELEDSYYTQKYERVTALSSTILQSVFKQICDLEGIEYSPTDKFPKLFSKVRNVLNLEAKNHTANPALRDFCSYINTIVTKVNELRNLYSESHGVGEKDYILYKNLPQHHIKLIVDTTKTITNFFIDTYEYQKNSISI